MCDLHLFAFLPEGRLEPIVIPSLAALLPNSLCLTPPFTLHDMFVVL